MNKAYIAVLAGLVLIGFFTVVAILLARGYFPDFSNRSLSATGILVATSDPDAASVYIDGKLKTGTNNTINLAPGTYDVKIAKDGYSPWEKKITIKKEEVIKSNAFLFPQVPGLSPLTLTGAINPTTYQDEKELVYGVASASAERNGIWVLGTGSIRPLIGGSDVKLIYQDTILLHLSDSQYIWSPDGSQILAYYTASNSAIVSADPTNIYRSYLDQKKQSTLISRAYLLDSSKLNVNPQAISGTTIYSQLSDWANLADDRINLTYSKLTPTVSDFMRSHAKNLSLSLDESKVLYIASTSGTFPTILNYYLPGTNPTQENRNLITGSTYVYDIKEDRNYLISNCGQSGVTCTWFPSSKHIIAYTTKEIAIMEFDGTNKSVLYTGPFSKNLVVPWPNWSKIVILTSLNSLSGGENLYTINLR